MAPSFRPLATPSLTTPSSGPLRHYPFPFPGDTHFWRHLLLAPSRHPFVTTPIRCPLLTPTPGNTLFCPLATPPLDNTTFPDPGETCSCDTLLWLADTLFLRQPLPRQPLPRQPLLTTASFYDTHFGHEAHTTVLSTQLRCTPMWSASTSGLHSLTQHRNRFGTRPWRL